MKSTPTSAYAPDLEELRAWLQKMIAALKFVEMIAAVLTLLARMRDINTELTTRLAHLKRKRPSSETLERLERQLLLPLVEIVTRAAPAPAAEEPKKKSRQGRHPGRRAIPANFPRIVVENLVPEHARRCPLCNAEMKRVGFSCCVKFNIVPAKIIAEERRDETLACPHDDTIVSAPPPPQIVERGVLGDTMLIEALCDKYIEHLPIERQCTRFARAGARIAPQTLGRGVNAAIDLLAPVAACIAVQTRAPGLLGTDATGIPILDRNANMGIRNGTIWCWTNARWVSFFYSPKGDSDSVRKFLGDDLTRTVQCDGTNVTSFLERAGGKRPGCWSHARRKLVEAAQLGDAGAREGLHIVARLFVVERHATLAGDSAEQRRARRHQHSRAILDELRQWLDDKKNQTPPKTPLGRALGYIERQWLRLTLFLDDGNIEATNNRRERELRRLVLGRKNWLFAWLDEGGKRTADILSIIATCNAHEVNPRAYLTLVANRIVHGWPHARLRDLLPDRMLAAHPELAIGDALGEVTAASRLLA